MGVYNNNNNKRASGSVNHIEHKYMPLVAGVLEQAEKDLKDAIKKRQNSRANAVKKWFISDWGQALSGNNGQLIIDRIYSEIKENKEGKTNERRIKKRT